MRIAIAPCARRRTHRREGLERQGPPTGVRWGTDRQTGAWWGLYRCEKRSEPSCCVNSIPALVTTTQGLRPGMIARQVDYSAARPLEILRGATPWSAITVTREAQPVREDQRRAPEVPVPDLPPHPHRGQGPARGRDSDSPRAGAPDSFPALRRREHPGD